MISICGWVSFVRLFSFLIHSDIGSHFIFYLFFCPRLAHDERMVFFFFFFSLFNPLPISSMILSTASFFFFPFHGLFFLFSFPFFIGLRLGEWEFDTGYGM